ncbi:TIGR03618 family F420-dependent PPOX class oxidoreductase [Microtetraspora sp. NBRC 13810]|uniref:TIGR03618 family F420-dependent PPOX class oxidoreductase n=1 Tax=Microtetraspora sp. NBRC 13810 TaxID=3030990 RepID=UPI0025567C1D|nr:TIGR03618 family F420-dependent PPOX class oxidoreductase [Microtetraspora sp. NBRC 13810]
MSDQKIPPSAYRLFETDRYATFVTVNPDGSPQVSLMWVSRDGDDLVFGVEDHRVKVRNLRADPRVTVMVEDEGNTPEGLRQHLVVRGTVTFEGPGIPDRFAAFMDRQARRYLGTDYPFDNRLSPTALIGRVRVRRVSGIGPWAG